jgi:hypothetical protein
MCRRDEHAAAHEGPAIGSARTALAGVHRTIRNIRIDHAHSGLNEGTAIVDFGNNAISMMTMVGLDCFTRPAVRREFAWPSSARPDCDPA